MNMNMTYPYSFTLVFSTTLVLAALAIRFLRPKKSRGQLPPGPGGWPIIGNLFQMIMNRPAHQWIHRVMEAMKTEIACFRFAGVHVIIVTSSEIAREVLREKDTALADRAEAYSIKLISHGYNGTIGDRTVEADNIVTYVYNICQSGSVTKLVNVRDVALTYSHAVMMRMLFGQRHFDKPAKDGGLGPKEKEHVDAVYRALDCLFGFSVADYLPFLRGWNVEGEEKDVREAVDIINRCNDPIIRERMHLWREKGGKETEEDCLDILITQKDDQGMYLFTFEEIRAQCKDVNVATMDNTMNTVEWTIGEMLNHQEILEKATKELNTVVGKDRLIQESDIPQLNYIKACCRESFRLHPPNAFWPPHGAREDTTLAGYFVPKGSQILVSRPGLGRNPKTWEKPDAFKPERHLVDHSRDSVDVTLMEPDMGFVVFGTGRRGCAGPKLGTTMIVMLLARLLQGFEWTLPPGASQVELISANTNLFMAKPLLASAKPRLAPGLYPQILI
ncbi:hypothetical protein Bca101_041860 [Brassica carinata]